MTSPALAELYRDVAILPADTPLPRHPECDGAPFRAIRICRTEAEMTSFSEPFICPDFRSLPSDPRLFADLIREESEVYGYYSSPSEKDGDWGDRTQTGAAVWDHFQSKTLDFNIVDSQCTDQNRILAGWTSQRLRRPPSVSWVLTLANTTTLFHVDPPYGDCFQYLCAGRKIWLLIPPADMAELEKRHGFAVVNTLPLADLLRLDDGFLWGKLHIGSIGAGDLLFFPENWPHFVRTLEPSFGFGGYFGGEDDAGAWSF